MIYVNNNNENSFYQLATKAKKQVYQKSHFNNHI